MFVRPTVLWICVLIAVSSLIPLPERGSTIAGLVAAGAHLIGYGALGASLVDSARNRSLPVLSAIALATGYGLAIELAQVAAPARAFEWSDVVLNAVGAAIGCVAARAARR